MTTTWVSVFKGSLSRVVRGRSVVGRDAALGNAARDERVELLEDGRVHRRRLVGRQQFLPDPVGLRRGLRRAGFLPRLVVAPIAEHRLVERGPVARLGVLRAEEVPARTDLLHRVEGE